MHAVKRLELFISEGWLSSAKKLLEKAGHGYSVLPVLLGHGGRGDRRLGDISGDGNVCLIAAMSESEVEALVEPLKELLLNAGGHVLISDAAQIRDMPESS